MITETMGVDVRISSIAPKADAWRSEMVTLEGVGSDAGEMFSILEGDGVKVDQSVRRILGNTFLSVPPTNKERDFVLLNGQKLFSPEDFRSRNFLNVDTSLKRLHFVACENPLFALRWAHYLKDNLLRVGDLSTLVMHRALYESRSPGFCWIKRQTSVVQVSLMQIEDKRAPLPEDLSFLYQIPGPYYPRGLKVA